MALLGSPLKVTTNFSYLGSKILLNGEIKDISERIHIVGK
jgi:hypothetical protein